MNCIYCLKEYTIKGIKKHHSFCKVKKEVEHQKKYDDEKIKINCDEYKVANKNDYLNNIPEDCLRIIFEFYNGKDEFTTSKRVCRNLFRVAVTCKRLYKIFNPPISLYKSHLVELKNKLYQTYAKKIYKLTDKDIECVKCENKYMYQTNCKLYLTVDILDKCLDKYGSHENFENMLKLKKIKKEKSEIKVSLLKENRRIKYNNLFIKYELLHSNTYYEFFDYIQYGTPSLSIIEAELNHIIDINNRYKLLYSLLNINNVKYESTNIAYDYINLNKYSLEEAYQTIFEINKRKKELFNIFNEHKIDAWANINNIYAKKYVYENLYNYDEICKIIIGRYNRLSSLKTILKTFNVKIKENNLINIESFKKYIDEGVYYTGDEKELDQNNYPQIIVEKYVNENKRTELLIKEFKIKNIKYYSGLKVYNKYIIDNSCNIQDIIDEINNSKSFYKNKEYYKNYIIIKNNYKINHIDSDYYAKLMTMNNISYSEELNEKYDIQHTENMKCRCNNIPSNVCGYCKSCCMHIYCIRHG